MRKSIIVALATLVFVNIFAQDEKIKQIRKDYNELKASITKLPEMKETGNMYCLTIDDNPYGGSYPAVGSFRVKTQFYYDIEGGEDPVLRMAIDTYAASAQRMYIEVLYQDNKPVFIFLKNNYQGDEERRLYLEDGQVIQYSENNVVKPYPDDDDNRSDLKAEADRLLQQFLTAKGHGY